MRSTAPFRDRNELKDQPQRVARTPRERRCIRPYARRLWMPIRGNPEIRSVRIQVWPGVPSQYIQPGDCLSQPNRVDCALALSKSVGRAIQLEYSRSVMSKEFVG